MRVSFFAGLCFLINGILASGLSLFAQSEYFLAVDGDDGNDGLSQQSAFATLQRGVDALEAGDTLTILPGEYLGSARAKGLGNDWEITRIRALIPGTAVIRGDVEAPEFKKLDDYRFVYAAPFDGDVHGVNELDSLSVLSETVSIGDVDVLPGSFYHDAEAGILYVAPAGFESAEGKRFTICVIPDHGLHLADARQVHIEGIDFRGFQQLGESHRHDRAGNTTWGLFISDGFRCVVQHCRAYFNNRGIGMSSDGVLKSATERETEIGYNLIQYCAAWANRTIYGRGGALNFFSPNNDQIRHSVSFLNGGIGIRMYQGNYYGLIYRNLAWGNGAQFDLKADPSVTSLRNVGIGVWGGDSVRRRVVHSLVGAISSVGEQFSDNIILDDRSVPAAQNPYRNLDLNAEFADPFHHDYRLQSTSRFRGAAGNGSDLGPFEFTPTVYFVAADGDDGADGLSTSSAWKTLGHAVSKLRAGDTLYIFPGRYEGALELSGINSSWDKPLRLRTRGAGAAVIAGGVKIEDCSNVDLRFLHFQSTVDVANSDAVVFKQSHFSGGDGGLRLNSTKGTRIEHNDFSLSSGAAVSAADSSGLFIAGNDFSGSAGLALAVDDAAAVLYSNYNTYRSGSPAWRVGGTAYAADSIPNRWESASVAVAAGGRPGAGLYSRLTGVYLIEPEQTVMESKPELLNATSTTANFEWYAASPAIFTVAWGTTPDTPNTAKVYGQSFFTFSLSKLKPGSQYYFRLVSAESISRDEDDADYESYNVDSSPLRFTTANSDRPAAVYYIGPDGDDAASGREPSQAWATFFNALPQLQPGDTLMVLDGTYTETVRVRTTGTESAPITIRTAPGATVVFDAEGRISNYFIVNYKDWIHLDGFIMRSVSRHGSGTLFTGSAISARSSANLTITRCMIDGRPIAYSGPLIAAYHCPDLLIQNCVQIDNMGPMRIIDSPNARVANCVFLRSKIAPMKFLNRPGDMAILENTIITDSLPTKANSMLVSLGYYPTLQTHNNGFFFRQPGDARTLVGVYGEIAYERSAAGHHILGRDNDPPHPLPGEVVVRTSVVDWHNEFYPDGTYIEGDPVFAVIAANAEQVEAARARSIERNSTWQTFDWITSGPQSRVPLSFADLFATNPEFLKRDIGLQPEAFAE